MMWAVAEEQGKRLATAYAQKFLTEEMKVVAYNAFFQGYIENAAERESLRQILKRHEKTAYVVPSGGIPHLPEPLAGSVVFTPSADSLI